MNVTDIFCSSGPFMPHGGCYLWTQSLIALHAISDALIVISYYSIPVTLIYFVRRRKDLKFHWMFVCFAVFILACGTTHLLEIWNIWHADYWLSGSIKAITALASVPTAFLLVKLIPQALALPSPDALQKAYGELEQRVQQRTAELVQTTERLKAEIAEREQTTAALRESEELFSKAFRLSPDFVAITRRSDRNILRANEALCQFWGSTPEQVVGHPGREFINWINEAERLAFMKTLEERGEYLDYESHFRLTDGRLVDFNISSRMITFGGEACILTVMRDVTERKRTAQALAESQALYHSLVEQMPAGVFRKDEAGRYVFVNSYFCRIRRTTPETFLGKLPGELPPTEAQFFTQAVNHHEQIMRTGQPIEVLDEYHRVDGQTLFLQVVKSPVFDADGKIIGSQGILFDVTKHKHAENEVHRLNAELEQRVIERTAQLEAANKELEAFSYSVSHDLRAPLRAINGFAGIVVEDFGPLLPTDGQNYLERIRNGAKRMGELIDDLLAFSRLSRQPIKRQEVDMNGLVKIAYDELRPQRAGRKIELKESGLPPGHGDPALLKQVWINLLSNAVKYSRGSQPAVIEIGCTESGTGKIYFVRDNGTGFDMQYAHKLFGVFQRLHRADEFEGTGVGLAIVQRIVQRHGGRVWAEAKENHGATFYFTLEGEK